MRIHRRARFAACAAAIVATTSCLTAAQARTSNRPALHPLIGYVTTELGRSGTNKLDRYDPATNRLLRPFTVGASPFGVAIAPGGRTAFVLRGNARTSSITWTVAAVDLATGRVKGVIKMPKGHPGSIAVSADGSFAYVALLRSIVVINTATMRIVKDIPTPQPSSVAVTLVLTMAPQGHTLYVQTWTEQTLTEINTATNTVSATLPMHVCLAEPAFSPDGRFMYVRTQDGVVPVDTSTGAAGPLTSVPDPGCTGDMLLTADGSALYVSAQAGQAHVFRINVATDGSLHVAWRTWVRKFPLSMALRGTTLYVSTSLHPFITPINTATGKAGRPIHDGQVTAARPQIVSCGRFIFVPQAWFQVANFAVINPVTRRLLRVIHTDVLTISTAFCSPARPVLLALLRDPADGHGWLLPISGLTGRAGRPIALNGEPTGMVFAR